MNPAGGDNFKLKKNNNMEIQKKAALFFSKNNYHALVYAAAPMKWDPRRRRNRQSGLATNGTLTNSLSLD